jgi:hypothetical protein
MAIRPRRGPLGSGMVLKWGACRKPDVPDSVLCFRDKLDWAFGSRRDRLNMDLVWSRIARACNAQL